VARDCIEPAESRNIDGFKVFRECWRYKDAYRCLGYAQNDCAEYDDTSDCQLKTDTGSCKEKVGEWCVAQNRVYSCEEEEKYIRKEKRYRAPTFQKKNKEERKRVECGEEIKCIDGKCFDSSYPANDEIANAAAMLATLKSMQGQYDLNHAIFKGEHKKCAKKAFGLNQCCKPGKKAFVEKVGLSSCDPGEKELAQLRAADRCHFVGKYKKKILGATQKTTFSYCCYESKIAKEINVQAREKGLTNKSFGDPKSPNCSGFTIEELQNLDFEKIDFGFLSEDIAKNNLWSKMGNMDKALEHTQNLMKGEISAIKDDILGGASVSSEDMADNIDDQKLYEQKLNETHNIPSSQKKPDGRDKSKDGESDDVLYNRDNYQNRDGEGL
jgi:conjugal transfer mating pair stabilization protein TraN